MKSLLYKHNYAIIISGLMLLSVTGPIFSRGRTEIIYGFRNYTRPEPIRMLLVGEIRSKIKVGKAQDIKSPYIGDTRHDQVTVRVVNRKGLKVGQKLFIIDKNPHHKKYRNGLIAGEIKVRAIFFHPFLGWVLTGTGLLMRVREGMFVARTLGTEKLERAYEKKKIGDLHFHRGDIEKAIASYQSALKADRLLPEAHAALGSLYLKLSKEHAREVPIRALAEYQLAWRNRKNFQYNNDEYRFYLDYMETLYFSYQMEKNDLNKRRRGYPGSVRHIYNIIRVGREAQRLFPTGKDVLLHLGRAHFYSMLHYGDKNRKKYDKSQGMTAGILKKLSKTIFTSAEYHRLSFLFYHTIYSAINRSKRVAEGQLRRNRALISYGSDFNRWENISYKSKTRGLVRFRRLLEYHVRSYYRYRDPAREEKDIELELKYKELRG